MAVYFDNPEFSDLKLILVAPEQEGTIHAHRVILANMSEYFQGLLTSNFKESQQFDIKIEVSDLDIAIQVLQWMYQPWIPLPASGVTQAQMWLCRSLLNEKEPDYPGKRGQFINVSSEDSRLEFRSTNDCILKRVSFVKNEGFTLAITFRKRMATTFSSYLEKYGIIMNWLSKYSGYYSTDSLTMIRQLIHIILSNNNFTGSDLASIQLFLDEI